MWGLFLGWMVTLLLIVVGAAIGVWRMLEADSWRDDLGRLWGSRYTSWDLRFREKPDNRNT